MSKVTDALIVIDTDKVLADHGTTADGSYTSLKNAGLGYVFMVAPWLSVADVANKSTTGQAQTYEEDEGGEKLRLAFEVGDVARFRSQPLAGPSSSQCFIDKITIGESGETSITAFNPVSRAVATTQLDPTVAPFTLYAPTSGNDYCLEATTLLPGKVPYTVEFSIYDAKLQRQGGYSFQSDLWVEDAFGATQIITEPTIAIDTPSVVRGTKLNVDYATPAGKLSSENWIGFYASSNHPGSGSSTTWQYAPKICGTLTFDTTNLAPGAYSVWYCYNNGNTTLAGPITVTVTSA